MKKILLTFGLALACFTGLQAEAQEEPMPINQKQQFKFCRELGGNFGDAVVVFTITTKGKIESYICDDHKSKPMVMEPKSAEALDLYLGPVGSIQFIKYRTIDSPDPCMWITNTNGLREYVCW